MRLDKVNCLKFCSGLLSMVDESIDSTVLIISDGWSTSVSSFKTIILIGGESELPELSELVSPAKSLGFQVSSLVVYPQKHI